MAGRIIGILDDEGLSTRKARDRTSISQVDFTRIRNMWIKRLRPGSCPGINRILRMVGYGGIPWLSTSKSRSAVPAAVWNCFAAAGAGPATGGSAAPGPDSAAGARKSSSATNIAAEFAGRANHWWSITDGAAMSRRP